VKINKILLNFHKILLKFTKIRMDFQLTNFFGEIYMIFSLSVRNENTTSMATQTASLIDHVMINDLSKRIDITHMPFRNLDHELMFVEVYHT
jgi:hypothetical protein